MFKRFLKQSSALLSQQQTSILSAAFVIMAMTLLGKILGVIILRLLVHYFGSGNVTAAYILASNVPELFFETLITSVLSVSFIPVFAGFLAQEDAEKASRMASAVITITMLVYSVIAIVAFFFAPQIAYLIAPGFRHDPTNLMLVANLTRGMLIAQFFLILGGYATAILQSYQRFLVPAFAATLYNFFTIVGIVLFAHHLGIFSAVVGMILGGLFQFLIQIPILKKGHFTYGFTVSTKIDGVRSVFLLAIPRMFGIASSTLIDNLDVILASLLSAVSVVSLDYATRLQIVPVSLFGAAIGQAALPSLTKAWVKSEKQEFGRLFFSSLNQILFFVFPVASVLIVLRLPIVRLLFGDPRFTWEATVLTGRTLAVFALAMLAQSMLMLVARAFYAMQDTKTPVYVSIGTLLLHGVLAGILIGVLRLPVWWLAGIFSMTTLTNALILLIILLRRIDAPAKARLILSPLKLFACAAAMTIVMYIPFRLMDMYIWEHNFHVGPFVLPPTLQLFILDTRYTVNVIILVGFVSLLGGLSYFGLAMLLKVEEVKMIQHALAKFNTVRATLTQSAEVIEVERSITH